MVLWNVIINQPRLTYRRATVRRSGSMNIIICACLAYRVSFNKALCMTSHHWSTRLQIHFFEILCRYIRTRARIYRKPSLFSPWLVVYRLLIAHAHQPNGYGVSEDVYVPLALVMMGQDTQCGTPPGTSPF